MIKTILVIEDDHDLRKYLIRTLVDTGFSVIDIPDGINALEVIEAKKPDLIVLDLGLPKLDGESVCREIKKNYPHIPVLILTGRNHTSDIVRGLNLGADDYITKPFKEDELLARIRARLRPTTNDGLELLRVADLELNPETFEVKRAGEVIPLSHKEYELLHYLMVNNKRVLSRDMILQRIWLTTDYIEPRVVDVYIGYLRKKIDGNGKTPLIHTIRGFGYVLKEE